MNRILSILLVLGLAQAVEAQETTKMISVQGVVRDADGFPTANVLVTDLIHFKSDDPKKPHSLDVQVPVRFRAWTDTRGKFVETLEVQGDEDILLLAYSDDFTESSMGRFSQTALEAGEIEITLEPSLRVIAKFSSASDELPLRGTDFFARAGGDVVVAARQSTGLDIMMPPGKFSFQFHAGGEFNPVGVGEEALTTEWEEYVFGEIRFKPTLLATLYGKPLSDWHVTDARGISKEVTLADFKGKWVFIEFWGFT